MPNLKTGKPSVALASAASQPVDISSPTVPAAADLFAPTVLVVDDHGDSRTVARLVLESAGFRVVEAATGIDGLSAALNTLPIVVLLDMVLPGLDGWELARRLRDNPATAETIIIAVTALAARDDQDRALLAGCNAVLTKPVPPSAMLRAIRERIGLPVPATGRSC